MAEPLAVRAVDWAVELLNLFTKVTFASGLDGCIELTMRWDYTADSEAYSNKTIENILKGQLVTAYRDR